MVARLKPYGVFLIPFLLLVLATLVSPRSASPQAAGGRATVNTSGLDIAYRTVTDWGSGFTGEIAITNRGTERIRAWQLEFDFEPAIVQIWNARQVTRTGTRYTIEGLSWNSFIDPGARVAFGFNGAPGSVAAPPAAYRLTAEGLAAPSTGGSGNVSVRYRTVDDWGSGFVGEVAVRNDGTQAVSDWRVEFDLSRTLVNRWNALLLAQQGAHFTFGPEAYNQRLAPGQESTFGFQGSPGNVAGVANLKVTPVLDSGPAPTPTPTPTPPGEPAPPRHGWLKTRGARIVDAGGSEVRLTGLNWFGLETSNYAPHGLWTRSMDSMLDQMSGLGYNCLRVPFSNQLFDAGSTPNGIDFHQNPDLVGKSGLQIMDLLVQKAGARGMKIILDRHRPDSGGQSELWYTDRYPEQRWIDDWAMLAKRYRDNPAVVGFDLHNEPHGRATWGDGNLATDWRLAAQRCGNRILAENPNLLIIVEGIEVVNGRYYWWGGNLKNAAAIPVMLNVANQLVYSAHDYPTSVYNQPWFSDPSYPANLRPLWDEFWGHLIKNDVAPVLLGEFGTFYQSTVDRKWFDTLASYLNETGASFTYWSWNPNSGDTGGLLKDDWRTLQTEKHAVLQPLLAPMFR